MIILTRTFDLLSWLLPKSEKFPKSFRLTLTQRTLDAALDFQETIFLALSQGGTTRQKLWREADAHLNKLRLYLRLIHKMKWINDGQFRHAGVMVAEIGRLLGGLMKKSKQAEKG